MCVCVCLESGSAMHSAWNVLFFCPEFWGHFITAKSALSHLRETCREFRSTIPERDALLCIFKGRAARKVDLFRLLPLSVHDVLKIKSPVDFTMAFLIAEHKAGGFENCMAIVRDRGWRLWLSVGVKRAELRQKLEGGLEAEGVVVTDSVYELAIQKSAQRAVVWRFACTFEGWMPWERYNPRAAGHSRTVSALMHKQYEYKMLLLTLRRAMGYWYKGIHKDVQLAVAAIRAVRKEERGEGRQRIHVSISDKALMVGVIVFRPWSPPPALPALC